MYLLYLSNNTWISIVLVKKSLINFLTRLKHKSFEFHLIKFN